MLAGQQFNSPEKVNKSSKAFMSPSVQFMILNSSSELEVLHLLQGDPSPVNVGQSIL